MRKKEGKGERKEDRREAKEHAEEERKEPRQIVSRKLLFFIIVVLVGYIIYQFHFDKIVEFLKQNPLVWAIVQHFTMQIKGKTLLGMFYSSFFGACFFVVLPIEVVFLYFLSLKYHFLLVYFVTVIGTVLGLIFDYLIGFLIGIPILRYFLKKKYERYSKLIERYGSWIIFVGNLIIFPIDIVSLIVGSLRFSFRKFVVYTLLGTAIKFAALIAFRGYIVSKVMPWVNGIF